VKVPSIWKTSIQQKRNLKETTPKTSNMQTKQSLKYKQPASIKKILTFRKNKPKLPGMPLSWQHYSLSVPKYTKTKYAEFRFRTCQVGQNIPILYL